MLSWQAWYSSWPEKGCDPSLQQLLLSGVTTSGLLATCPKSSRIGTVIPPISQAYIFRDLEKEKKKLSWGIIKPALCSIRKNRRGRVTSLYMQPFYNHLLHSGMLSGDLTRRSKSVLMWGYPWTLIVFITTPLKRIPCPQSSQHSVPIHFSPTLQWREEPHRSGSQMAFLFSAGVHPIQREGIILHTLTHCWHTQTETNTHT